MRHRHPLIGFILGLFMTTAAFASQAPGEKTRVACVGDSITAGARVDVAKASYPAQLQLLLGSQYQVENFGRGGATLIRSGHPNVWQTLENVKSFKPHYVVIALGTNDTVGGNRQNWENIDSFDSDYRELLKQLAELESKPQILISTPTAMVLSTPGLSPERIHNLQERQPRLQELCRRIRDLSARTSHPNVKLLELNPILAHRPDWVTQSDGVHPNERGYYEIAKVVASRIKAEVNRPKRPNIVLFLVDDMGWQDTSVPFHSQRTPLNRQYRTPNMERLAAMGMKFTQAYACSVCSPTRVSLMTGLNAARHRVTNWTLRKNASNDARHATLDFPQWNVNGLSPDPGIERTVHAKALPKWLQEVGYRTIHIGKAHFGAVGTPAEDPLTIGFDVNVGGHAAGGPGSFLGQQNFSAQWRGGDRIWDVPGLESFHGQNIFLTEALTQRALEEMTEAAESNLPFFLYLSHYAVHVPFAEDSRFIERYLAKGLDRTEAMYAAMVEGMDKSLGDILDRIQQLELAENTIVLFLSDNGGLSAHGRGGPKHRHNAPLSSGKGSAHEGGVRVPMIVHWPGITHPESINRQPVIIEDVYPTILEMAGVEDASQIGGILDGWSFVNLLQASRDPRRQERPLFWHFPNHWGPSGPGIGPSSSVRLGDWKLIRYYDNRPTELFNLTADLGETTNLFESQPGIGERLLHQLDAFLKETKAQLPFADTDL